MYDFKIGFLHIYAKNMVDFLAASYNDVFKELCLVCGCVAFVIVYKVCLRLCLHGSCVLVKQVEETRGIIVRFFFGSLFFHCIKGIMSGDTIYKLIK